jgi:hypothetical protein
MARTYLVFGDKLNDHFDFFLPLADTFVPTDHGGIL